MRGEEKAEEQAARSKEQGAEKRNQKLKQHASK